MLAAEIQILAHGHFPEQLSRFRTMYDPAAGDLRRAGAAQLFTIVQDFTAVWQKSGNRIEERGLPGTIQADHRDEFTLMNMDANVLQRLRLAVADTDIVHLQQGNFIREA